jgi:cell division protein FtsQ
MAMQEILEGRRGADPTPRGRRSPPTPDSPSDLKDRPERAGRPIRNAPSESRSPIDRKTRREGLLRVRFRAGVVPRSTPGRIFAALAVLAGFAAVAYLGYLGQRYILEDQRFIVPSSASIQVEGNSHLSRAQLLSVFGEDVDRNIFSVPLAERRAQLEQLPWVKHATVMRLLPNKLRIAIVERTPVAYVRQGSQIGLVDASGVLLDLDDADQARPANANGTNAAYSFPVVTGITAQEPLSVRAARMKILEKFTHDLDSGSDNVSSKLSEVDLSNPEDVKALIPEQGTEILVHFGDTDFLDRYHKFEDQLPTWRAQYPKLASADMRYDRQVVLEMANGSPVPELHASNTDAAKPLATAVKHPAPVAKSPAAKTADAKSAHPKPVSPHPLSSKTLSAYGQPHFPGESGTPATPGKHVISSKTPDQ